MGGVGFSAWGSRSLAKWRVVFLTRGDLLLSPSGKHVLLGSGCDIHFHGITQLGGFESVKRGDFRGGISGKGGDAWSCKAVKESKF